MTHWRGLLVSVRDGAEAAAALAGGAAIIDVKEPARGALGAADPAVVAAIAAVVGGRTPWTMACGELAAGVEAVLGHVARVRAAVADAAVSSPAAVKVGMAGRADGDWQREVGELWANLPPGVERVAVAYADWRNAAAPPPDDMVAMAASAGGSLVLVDTFDKSRGGLLECCPPPQLAGLIAACHAAGLRVAVAGRITLAEIPTISALGPDIVALRSAVCSNADDGGTPGPVRLGTVREDLVRHACRLVGAVVPANTTTGESR